MDEYKRFPRIQEAALKLEIFDLIQSFPECGGDWSIYRYGSESP